jgi:hypothetical protein
MKWNLTPPLGFLSEVLVTFNIQSMQLLRHSPSPDIEEENITIGEETLGDCHKYPFIRCTTDIEEENITIDDETLGNCHKYPFIRCSSYLAPILFPAVQFGALCH